MVASQISLDDLTPCFYFCAEEAAKRLGVGLTVLKRRCRELGIVRWPFRPLQCVENLIKHVKENGVPNNKDAVEQLRQLHVQKTMILSGGQAQLPKWAKKLQQQCSKLNYRAKKNKKHSINESITKKRKRRSLSSTSSSQDKANIESEEMEDNVQINDDDDDDEETETDDEIAMIMSKKENIMMDLNVMRLRHVDRNGTETTGDWMTILDAINEIHQKRKIITNLKNEIKLKQNPNLIKKTTHLQISKLEVIKNLEALAIDLGYKIEGKIQLKSIT